MRGVYILLGIIAIFVLVFVANYFVNPQVRFERQQRKEAEEEMRKQMEESQQGTEGRDEAVAKYGDKVARIDTDFGTIVFELYPGDAPKTVENFVTLAEKGFYDNLIFHRVIKGFMIQTGCPQGTGTGGPGYMIKAEFNARRHVAGTVAMARSGDPDSAGSQFFICHKASPHLDGQYTVFGQVIEGQDVVDNIATVPTGPGDKPMKPIKMKRVTIVPKSSVQ